MIEIVIPGVPIGQGRIRAACVNGKPRLYDPKKSREWKEMARDIIGRYARRCEFIKKPQAIGVDIEAVFMRPKSNKTTDHIQKPDIDNIVKIVMDCMTGLIMEDDSQIVSVNANKSWGKGDYVRFSWGVV